MERRGHRSGLFAGIALATGGMLLFGISAPAKAELQHINQLVYGMDCAPCAFGIERRIKGLEGVADVAISLDAGTVEVAFAADNRVTLHQIRNHIRRGGFEPKSARVDLTGRLQQGPDGALLLTTKSGEDFHLEAASSGPEAWDDLSQMEAGRVVAISGEVQPTTDDEPSAMRLSVEKVTPRD